MRRNPLSLAAVVALSVGLLACSKESVSAPELVATAPLSAVDPIPGFYPFTANNDGVEFWDNLSVDKLDESSPCNVGFFAANAYGPCNNPIGVNMTTSEFVGGQFWGSDEGAKGAPFTMGAGSYTVTFLGGNRGYKFEEAGWFTKPGGTYAHTPIPATVSSEIGGVVVINSPAMAWGFYVKPDPVTFSGGDGCDAGYWCSDDTQLQQFALFKKTGSPVYLVGIEDKGGSGVSGYPDLTSGDRDYNDFFLRVQFNPPTERLDGRMTGGGTADLPNSNQPLQVAITIHCDLTLSNNIQINWGGNKWHLDKPITESMCAYVRDPAPPAAPINVFSGVGFGKLNGEAGSRLEFTFTDRAFEAVSKPGEPNGGNDTFSLKIFNLDGTVAFQVTDLPLRTGNFQAHYDQPHK